MKASVNTVEEYLKSIPETKEKFLVLRQAIIDNLPLGFEECMNYGMIGYVVPHSIYPSGYHCDTSLPLPFLNIAVQKNFIGFYHMGLYANKELYDWFITEYPNYCNTKLDMGKSCVRFKKTTKIPSQLIGELVSKVSVEDWIVQYESALRK